MASVLTGKAWRQAISVLKQSSLKVVGHACVEHGVGAIGEDINEVGVFFH